VIDREMYIVPYIVQVKSKMRKDDKDVKGVYAKMMSAFKF